MASIKQKSHKSPFITKRREADLTSFISNPGLTISAKNNSEKDRDVKQQIDKLIEATKNEFMKYESYSKDKNTSIAASNYGPGPNSISSISGSGVSGPSMSGLLHSNPKNNSPQMQEHDLNSGVKAVLVPRIAEQTAEYPSAGSTKTLLDNFQESDYSKRSGVALDVVVGNAAASIAKEIGASCIISIERKNSHEPKNSNGENHSIDSEQKDENYFTVQVSIFKKAKNGYERVEYKTRMRKVMSGSIVPVKELLMEAINRKYIRKGDRVVCVEDESLGMGYKALLLIFDVDKIFFNISTLNLAEHISPEVIESAINVGLEIGKEGREGRKVGTAFIIGNPDELKKYTKQMIINPFLGYPEEMRNITDPNMKETLKNYAQLDGVFLVSDKGVIMTAGAYLNVDGNCVELPSGYGTRHRCSAAMTKTCDCIAIVISESGGLLSIFKGGRVMMKLP